jgi:hypothetical protein
VQGRRPQEIAIVQVCIPFVKPGASPLRGVSLFVHPTDPYMNLSTSVYGLPQTVRPFWNNVLDPNFHNGQASRQQGSSRMLAQCERPVSHS